ncbi:hypothetical protein ACTA71_006893 [Dictyostelium dimigraforme]
MKIRPYFKAFSPVRVVAATITGASRLKKVFDSINSKCVIIEEAAEILEGHIVSVLPKTIEHLILIGDHEQLKSLCAVYQLAEKFQLNVSLFERIMKNGGTHGQLSIQRRMVPNISQFIDPIYPNLRNHPEVSQRFTVESKIKVPESSPTESTSKSNLFEADYAVGLADYLSKQEYRPKDMVILTPLVHSNERGDGGFVKIKNRINQGGCLLNYSTRLECGHRCSLACHIYDQDHINIKCTKPCEHVHEKCGHICKKTCLDECGLCEELIDRIPPCGLRKSCLAALIHSNINVKSNVKNQENMVINVNSNARNIVKRVIVGRVTKQESDMVVKAMGIGSFVKMVIHFILENIRCNAGSKMY